MRSESSAVPENQRIRLSKQMLKDALLRLLKREELEAITVQALCTEAQINRSTFYRYYGSTRDVLDAIREDFLTEMESGIRMGAYDAGLSLQQTLHCLWENRELVEVLQRTYSENALLAELIRRQPVLDQLSRHARRGYTGADADYAMDFFIYGSWAIIRRWLQSGDQSSLQHIAALLLEINRSCQRSG